MRKENSPEILFGHIYGEACGFLVTFTGRQARLDREDARTNELAEIRQRSFEYPARATDAGVHLLDESSSERDAYVGVHLFREGGNRRASNAEPTVQALWLDEDDGDYPEVGPEPTAVVHSSASRRHLYWRLTQPVAVEWAVQMNRRIATWACGDIGKAHLASVLRVPGTKNFKRHPQVDLVTMDETGVRAWPPEIMEQAIPEMSEPSLLTGTRPTEPYDGPELAIADFFSGVEVLGEVPDGHGVKFQVVCPWISEHSGGDRTGTYVGQRADGGLWFYCHHAHCQHQHWSDFRNTQRLRAKKLALVRKGLYA